MPNGAATRSSNNPTHFPGSKPTATNLTANAHELTRIKEGEPQMDADLRNSVGFDCVHSKALSNSQLEPNFPYLSDVSPSYPRRSASIRGSAWFFIRVH